MSAISRSISLAILMAGVSGCAAQPEEHEAAASWPLLVVDRAPVSTPSFCGQSPTSITYWASAWQRDILDADGVIGGCQFDAACLPSCWGATSDWTTWAGPLIQCPCH